MYRIVCLAALAVAACAGPAATVSKTAGPQIFEAAFEDLPEHGITKFDIRVSAEAPPWRAWNVVISDPQRLAELTNGEAQLTKFAFVTPTEVDLRAEIDVAWFLPNLEVEAKWFVHPDQFGWEQQCSSAGSIGDCYIRGGFSPLDGGKRTLVHYQGYIRRPWYVSHGRAAESLVSTFENAQASLDLVAQQPKYGNPNTKYPWDDLNAFSSAGPGAAPEAAASRARLLVQDFVVSSASATDTTVIRLASTYLAERLAASRKFDVLTDWDVRVMAKYLNADWQATCKGDPACTEKLLSITKSKYVLAGEVARAADRYTLSFVVMNAETLTPAWRFNREIPAASADLRAAVAEAADEVARSL